MEAPALQHISEQDIVNYYDSCERDYRLLWHLKEQQAMHYGFWKEDTRRLREALRNMNEYVLSKLHIKKGDKLLDAGCGVGGSSIYAARNFECEVWGITLSQQQSQRARDFAEQFKLKGKTNFEVQNFCNTRFENNYFDGVFGIESICHALSKSDFFKEASRILKLNGTLVIADFIKKNGSFSAADEQMMSNWADSWAVPHFSSENDFIAMAANRGFELVDNVDITDNILRSAKRLYYCFIPGMICHHSLSLIGRRNETHRKNVWSTYYQYKSLKRNLWKYRVFTFKKTKDYENH